MSSSDSLCVAVSTSPSVGVLNLNGMSGDDADSQLSRARRSAIAVSARVHVYTLCVTRKMQALESISEWLTTMCDRALRTPDTNYVVACAKTARELHTCVACVSLH
jgi:hypothetical protein